MKKLVRLTIIYLHHKSSAVVTADVQTKDGWDTLTVPDHIMNDMATELGCPSGTYFTYIISEDLCASFDDSGVFRSCHDSDQSCWRKCL